MRITKWTAALGIIAVVALSTTAAYATHVFTDVEDDRFFADAAEWAKDNGITTGCGDGTTFCPDDPVTRGENVTFAKRYDDNIVQPKFDELDATNTVNAAAIAANTSDIDALQAADNIEHGSITISDGYGEWYPNAGTGGAITLSRFTDIIRIAGGGGVQADINGPTSIDGTPYRLESVTYCLDSISGTATITSAVLRSANDQIGADTTVRSFGDTDCYEIEVTEAPTRGIVIFITTTSGGNVQIDHLYSTWSPDVMMMSLGDADPVSDEATSN